MQIQGNDKVIDELLTGKDEVIFNLIQLIRAQQGACLYTDGKSYLAAQSGMDLPLWLYVAPREGEKSEREIFDLLSRATEKVGRLSVNAKEEFAGKLLTRFAERNGFTLTKRNPMNVYAVKEVNSVPPVGRMIAPSEEHEVTVAILIQQAAADDNDRVLTEEQAIQFASVHLNTGNLYLWEDGAVVSMARVVYYGKYARITSVVTERASRGKGYAKMLVGELAERMLKKGLIPVLYARSENPSSNRCYQGLGFEKAGEVTEFKLER